jgi:hypothetical protein
VTRSALKKSRHDDAPLLSSVMGPGVKVDAVSGKVELVGLGVSRVCFFILVLARSYCLLLLLNAIVSSAVLWSKTLADLQAHCDRELFPPVTPPRKLLLRRAVAARQCNGAKKSI